MLGDDVAKWSKKIIISDDLLVFERKFVFVEYVGMSEEGLSFQLSPRADLKPIAVKVTARNSAGLEVVSFANNEMTAQPSATIKRWRISKKLPNGIYRIEIRLEGHLAYRANVGLGDRLV
jgi:hypothetical protein